MGLSTRLIYSTGLNIPDVEQFHSLTTIKVPSTKTDNLLEYTNWLYKAVSSHDGLVYCLRRLEGRLAVSTTI